MNAKNLMTDDLEKLRPEKPENNESKRDESIEVLMERFTNSEKIRKEQKSKHKKENFLLIFIAAAFFLLFVESIAGAKDYIIIVTTLAAVLIFLWILAKWAGFRPLAARLGRWVDFIEAKIGIISLHTLQQRAVSTAEEYEDLPPQ